MRVSVYVVCVCVRMRVLLQACCTLSISKHLVTFFDHKMNAILIVLIECKSGLASTYNQRLLVQHFQLIYNLATYQVSCVAHFTHVMKQIITVKLISQKLQNG